MIVQVTLVIRASLSAVLCRCHEEHQYPIRGQHFKLIITCVGTSPGLSWNVIQISLASKNSDASIISIW